MRASTVVSPVIWKTSVCYCKVIVVRLVSIVDSGSMVDRWLLL